MYFLGKYVGLHSGQGGSKDYEFVLLEARLFLDDPEKYQTDNGIEQAKIIKTHLENDWVRQQLRLI